VQCALPSPFLADNGFSMGPDNGFSMGKKTPSRRQAMRPIVNMPEEDRATDISNMHKNLVKIARCFGDISRTDRQTDTQTDTQTGILITILRNGSRGRSDKISCLSVTYIYQQHHCTTAIVISRHGSLQLCVARVEDLLSNTLK